MAWGPPCRTEGNRWGESLLAVANEYLEIVLFRFFFPLPVWGLWWGADRSRVSFDKTEIVGHVTPFPEELVAKYLGNLATHVTSLRWGPWMLGANGKRRRLFGPGGLFCVDQILQIGCFWLSPGVEKQWYRRYLWTVPTTHLQSLRRLERQSWSGARYQ